MKILFVAMGNSVHTVRWLRMLADTGWDIRLFPANFLTGIHPELEVIRNIKIYSNKVFGHFIKKYKKTKKERQSNLENLEKILRSEDPSNINWRDIARKVLPDNRVRGLVNIIKRFKPDLLHSMHIQEGGYLAIQAKRILKDEFPRWLVTNWGSELNLFSKISTQESKIKEVLENCDYLSGECSNDIRIARALGFKGEFIRPIVPNSGGLDFDYINKIKKPGPTSERKLIMLKGYQNWAGRSLVGMRALERCSDVLQGYKIAIYCIDSMEVAVSAELFTKNTGVPVEIIPMETPHEEILCYHGRSRISIGLSITDAISTSLLEAMVMGSFPIQSNTSCGSEWLEDGRSGIFVNPEDPEDTERAVRRAVADDELVNSAAELNYNNLLEKLNYKKVQDIVVNNYKKILSGQHFNGSSI